MTSDEFERLALAIANMRGLVVNGILHVDVNIVLHIIHSNLHHEDKELWKFDPVTKNWFKAPRL